MIVAFDFDETYNLDPNTWDKVIRALQTGGHKVVLATYRHPTLDYDPLFERLAIMNVSIFCTDGKAKKQFLMDRGINVHVWIDDNPNSILLDSAWKDDSPELHAWRAANQEKMNAAA
jgi:hypothetical protein